MQYTGYSWASLGQSASYIALLKHFHVLIIHNYPRPTIVVKLFLQSNTEHNIQLHSQIRNINHTFYSVGPRTKAQPNSFREICKNTCFIVTRNLAGGNGIRMKKQIA